MMNIKNKKKGENKILKEEDIIEMKIYLRSEEKDRRIIHFVINNKEKECFFYDIPLSVKVGVCYFLYFYFYSFYFSLSSYIYR